MQSFLEAAGEAISPAERQWLKDRHAAAGADTSQARSTNVGKADSQEVAVDAEEAELGASNDEPSGGTHFPDSVHSATHDFFAF